VAQSVPLAALGELGEQMAAMPSLYASLDLFCREICEKVISHIGFWLTRHDGKIWFCRTPPPCLDSGLKHPEQFAVLFMIELVRMFAGENWCPEEVWLRSNEKKEFIDHPSFRNTEIRFPRNITAVALPTLEEENSIISNLSFREMIQQIRFELSCQMLEATDASIEEIADELSYSSPSNFSRAFRQWAGVSPHEFCQQKRLPFRE
jgi:hypothetical protein